MKFGSVCSGIEAASVAWQPLGWQAQWFSEIEPFPCALLKHHYPATPNLGDMTQFESWPTDDQHAIDLLCGGTPCQSFSVAGLRAGLDDPRGNLMLTFGAIAAKYRPQWLVWENVPGVLSSNGGRDFGTFLGMLGQLGYGFAYRVLDAQYFGVAQRRRRVFVVGYFGDWRRAAAVLFERHSLQGHPAPGRQAGKVAPTIPSRSTAGGGLGTDFDLDGGTICVSSHQWPAETAETAGTLDAHFGDKMGLENQHVNAGCPLFVPALSHSLRGEGFDASEDGTGRGTPLVPVATCRDCGARLEIGWGQWCDFCGHDQTEPRAYRTAGDGAVFEEGDITAPLTTGTDPCANIITGAMPAIAFQERGRADGPNLEIGGELAFALTAPNGGGRAQERNILTPAMAVRRLTPEECEALQGFKRGYTLVPHRGKPAADGPRYKALGNSWAVPNVRWIGERIEAVALIKSSQAAMNTVAELETA